MAQNVYAGAAAGRRKGYDFYLGPMRLPVTPQKCEMNVKNRDETISLLEGGEMSRLRDPGLSEIEFECLLPQVPYPFAEYGGAFRPAAYYLNEIERLKVEKKPFQFIVSRAMPGGRVLYATNMKVSLEEYSITEDAGNGFDVTVKIRLRQYRDTALRTASVRLQTTSPDAGYPRKAPVRVQPAARPESTVQPVKPITVGCSVILNGQLFRDSYGGGPGAVYSNYQGVINFINMSGSHPYHVATPAGGWLGWVTAGSVRAV